MDSRAARFTGNLLAAAVRPEATKALLARDAVVPEDATIATDWEISAQELASLPVATAEAIARYPGAHPSTLAALAKQPRKGVKRIVAENFATPRETLLALLRWAVANDDLDTIRALGETLPPTAVLPHLDGRAGLCAAWSLGAVKYFERTRDDDALCHVLKGDLPGGARWQLFAAAAHGRLPLSARALYDRATVAIRDRLIAQLFNEFGGSPSLDADAQLLIEDHLYERPATKVNIGSRTQLLLPTEVEILRHSDDSAVRFAIARALSLGEIELDDLALADFVERVDSHTVARVLLQGSTRLFDQFTGHQLARLCPLAFLSSASQGVRRKILLEKGAGLSEDEVLAVLGETWEWSTVPDWLVDTSESVAPVSISVLERYARQILLAPDRLAVLAGVGTDPLSNLLVFVSRQWTTGNLRTPVVLDLMNTAGSATLAIASDQHVSGTTWGTLAVEYIAERVAERFGDRTDVWKLVPEVRPAGTMTLDQWLDMIAALVAQ